VDLPCFFCNGHGGFVEPRHCGSFDFVFGIVAADPEACMGNASVRLGIFRQQLKGD